MCAAGACAAIPSGPPAAASGAVAGIAFGAAAFTCAIDIAVTAASFAAMPSGPPAAAPGAAAEVATTAPVAEGAITCPGSSSTTTDGSR